MCVCVEVGVACMCFHLCSFFFHKSKFSFRCKILFDLLSFSPTLIHQVFSFFSQFLSPVVGVASYLMGEMLVWNLLSWNATTVLTLQVTVITLQGMCL